MLFRTSLCSCLSVSHRFVSRLPAVRAVNCQLFGVGAEKVSFESRKLAKMADGAVVATHRDTSVLVTAVSRSKASPVDFMPLTVDYRQKAAAGGRIPTNFLRRELGPSDVEILTSRMIDRSLRPLFCKGYYHDTQIICNLLAVDGVTDPDVLSINAASASLATSDIPWNGPVAAVRLGLVNDQVLINPDRKEQQTSELNLVMTATSGRRILMIEMEGAQVSVQNIKNAMEIGLDVTERIIDSINELRKIDGKPKRQIAVGEPKPEIDDCIDLMATGPLYDIFSNDQLDKFGRDNELQDVRKEMIKKLSEDFPDDTGYFDGAISATFLRLYREFVFKTGERCDGRNLKQLRPITCEHDLYPPLHGSGLFQRGQTQVLSAVTFDSKQSAFRSDTASLLSGAPREKKFLLHYEFPPYATNEVSTRGSKRRELGHGALAEKALRCLLPDEWPFTIRLTCEVLESNGSSSMASVCAGSMALLDAGVNLKAAASGVAIGLLTRQNDEGKIEDYRLLTDLVGIEDYYGDMDFKIAGTRDGVTAMQLDLKIGGIPLDIVMEAINRAQAANSKILGHMDSRIWKPRKDQKKCWPVSEKLTLAAAKRARLVGLGGYNIKRLQSETGVQISTIDDTTFEMFAPNQTAMTEANEQIEKLLVEHKPVQLDFGAVYAAKIVELKSTGAMVVLYEEMSPVFVPLSQLDARRVKHPSALGLAAGQTIKLKYFGPEPDTGSLRLSHKVLQSTQPPGRHLVQPDEIPSPTEVLDKPTVKETPWKDTKAKKGGKIEENEGEEEVDDPTRPSIIFQPLDEEQQVKKELPSTVKQKKKRREKRGILWDPKHPNYFKRKGKGPTWVEIATEINLSHPGEEEYTDYDCSEVWSALRKEYMRKRRQPGKSGRSWVFFSSMTFLNITLDANPQTASNFSQSLPDAKPKRKRDDTMSLFKDLIEAENQKAAEIKEQTPAKKFAEAIGDRIDKLGKFNQGKVMNEIGKMVAQAEMADMGFDPREICDPVAEYPTFKSESCRKF